MLPEKKFLPEGWKKILGTSLPACADVCIFGLCLELFYKYSLISFFSFLTWNQHDHSSTFTFWWITLSCTSDCVSSEMSSNEDIELFALSDVMCKTSAQADIILLVDGSWSIGRLNFKTIRSFIARMVGVFDISPKRVQIGESDRPKKHLPKSNFKAVIVCRITICGLFRSCPVQRRPEDWVAFGCSPNQGIPLGCNL